MASRNLGITHLGICLKQESNPQQGHTSAKFNMIFQQHCCCKPHGALHADLMPDILFEKCGGQIVRKGIWGEAPRKFLLTTPSRLLESIGNVLPKLFFDGLFIQTFWHAR